MQKAGQIIGDIREQLAARQADEEVVVFLRGAVGGCLGGAGGEVGEGAAERGAIAGE